MNTIIIEDDSSIRKGIKILIQRYAPYIIVQGEATTVTEGYKIIAEKQPEVLLLDIQLTDGSSFDILTQLHKNFPAYKPKLIFITAYQEFALKALKCSALDYLLKPIDPIEFKNALTKLSPYENDSYPQVEVVLGHLKNNLSNKKIALHTQSQTYIVAIKDIVRCESDANYTKVYLQNDKSILISKTLKWFDDLLQSENFERVHQSHLVNIQFIKTYYKSTGLLELSNTEKIPVATRKKELITHIITNLIK